MENRKILKAKRSNELNVGNESDDCNFFKEKGDDYFKSGKLLEAITFYTQAIMSKPSETDSRYELGQLHLARANAYQRLGLPSKSRSDCLKAAEYFEEENEEEKKDGEESNTSVKVVRREVNVDTVAKLQVRLQPLLARYV